MTLPGYHRPKMKGLFAWLGRLGRRALHWAGLDDATHCDVCGVELPEGYGGRLCGQHRAEESAL